jgi:hypothetical protein
VREWAQGLGHAFASFQTNRHGAIAVSAVKRFAVKYPVVIMALRDQRSAVAGPHRREHYGEHSDSLLVACRPESNVTQQ